MIDIKTDGNIGSWADGLNRNGGNTTPTWLAALAGVVGAAGLATGITALSTQNDGCGGRNGHHNNNNCGCGGGGGAADAFVLQNQFESKECAVLRQQLATVNAERYADQVGINTFKECMAYTDKVAGQLSSQIQFVSSNVKQLNDFAIGIDKSVAVSQQQTSDNFAFLNNKIDCTNKETLCYVNSRFVPGQLIMPADNIFPKPLAACVPVALPGQVINTSPVPTTGEIPLRQAS